MAENVDVHLYNFSARRYIALTAIVNKKLSWCWQRARRV